MASATYLAYLAACIAIIIVPGPTVTLIVANSLRHGIRAGLLNVAGTQIGLVLLLAVLALGLTTIVASAGALFDWVRLLGAAYLVWLGIKLWRSDGSLSEGRAGEAPKGGFVWQGLLVILSNPKALLFIGAFIPQFLDPARPALPQIVLLGATFMAVGTLLDGAYALAAGKAGIWLSRGHVRLVERISGSFLICGGLWIALLRR
jgi:threonine/homoserine/homoserine lactone efflux protein